MNLRPYSAAELFQWLTEKEDFLLLDVRNNVEFDRFKVEGPYPIHMANVPYMEFIEFEEESVAKVPRADKVRIVCAKEGSAKYVGEILVKNGYRDVAYLEAGIKSWGNYLAPARVSGTDGYELHQFRRPGKASCSYALVSGNEMMVFDPAKNISAYQMFAHERGCAVTKTFETHRQADYISGSPQLAASTGAQIIGNENDFHGAAFEYKAVQDNEIFNFSNGGPEIKALHMPGHTPGSTSYLIDNRYLVTGDTVFILSIGRPDLGGKAEEWSKLLYKTLKSKIDVLDDDLIILPGHYIEWGEANSEQMFIDTLGSIKRKNANIYGIQKEADFVQFIVENIRKQPDEYAEIRKVNAGLLKVDDEDQEIMDLGKNECAASMYANK